MLPWLSVHHAAVEPFGGTSTPVACRMYTVQLPHKKKLLLFKKKQVGNQQSEAEVYPFLWKPATPTTNLAATTMPGKSKKPAKVRTLSLPLSPLPTPHIPEVVEQSNVRNATHHFAQFLASESTTRTAAPTTSTPSGPSHILSALLHAHYATRLAILHASIEACI